MANPNLRVWSASGSKWIGVGPQNVFSTVKLDNDIFFDAQGNSDTLVLLGGDNIKILPNDTFTSIVITTSGIGDPATLATINKEIVSSINEINTLVSNHNSNSNVHVTVEDKNKWNATLDTTTGGTINGDVIVNGNFNSIVNLSSDPTAINYSGDIAIEVVVDNCSQFDLVYLTSTGYKMASAADESNNQFPCVAMCLEVGSGNKKLLKRGHVTNTSWSFIKGQLIYLSATTAGFTTTKPSNPNEIIQIIGYATNTNTMYFNPQYIWVTI